MIAVGTATPSAANLVAHWPFEKATGSVAADIAGNGHDGALLGSPRFTEGPVGGALTFAADGDRMSIPHHPDLDFGASVTIAAWLRPDLMSTQYVVKKGRDGENDGYALNLSGDGRLCTRSLEWRQGFRALQSGQCGE